MPGIFPGRRQIEYGTQLHSIDAALESAFDEGEEARGGGVSSSNFNFVGEKKEGHFNGNHENETQSG
jgi:hypothetical protein